MYRQHFIRERAKNKPCVSVCKDNTSTKPNRGKPSVLHTPDQTTATHNALHIYFPQSHTPRVSFSFSFILYNNVLHNADAVLTSSECQISSC